MKYLILGCCLLAAGCSGEGSRAPTSPSTAVENGPLTDSRGGSDLPFRGTLEATETASGSGIEQHHLVGTGNATLLGRYSLTADIEVDTSNGHGTGTTAWTAANGDQIFTTLTGQGTVTTFPTAVIIETLTITGGTGRFSGASGTIQVDRTANLLTLVSSGSLTGTINLNH